jgi:dodecin
VRGFSFRSSVVSQEDCAQNRSRTTNDGRPTTNDNPSLDRYRANAPPEYNPTYIKEKTMTQKIIDVVGSSKESFAKAAEAAVKEAAKTVRKIKWAHVESFDMLVDGGKVKQYRATTKIYFDVEG